MTDVLKLDVRVHLTMRHAAYVVRTFEHVRVVTFLFGHIYVKFCTCLVLEGTQTQQQLPRSYVPAHSIASKQ